MYPSHGVFGVTYVFLDSTNIFVIGGVNAGARVVCGPLVSISGVWAGYGLRFFVSTVFTMEPIFLFRLWLWDGRDAAQHIVDVVDGCYFGDISCWMECTLSWDVVWVSCGTIR